MAPFDEASPICRGKNLSWETVLLFYNNMPRKAMPKADFYSFTEAKINGWKQTHSQIARQLAFYYEENGICYPRFTKELSYTDLFAYMQNWAAKYFIPNPYAPSLKNYTPTCIYAAILKAINSGETNFDTILDSMFGVELSSHDKVRVYLSNFTDLIIDENNVSINDRTMGVETFLNPEIECATDVKKYFDYFSIASKTSAKENRINNNIPLQRIYYGAPGTGKSYEITQKTKGSKDVVRTTFHPDSDYSTFVGAYKPTMGTGKVYGAQGPLRDNGKDIEEPKIVYEFVEQAFLQAYILAWEKYVKDHEEKQFLVIEEINRGNCAQIFGDIFQLLDRRKDGFSDYPINPDKDIRLHLKQKLKELSLTDIPAIDNIDGNDLGAMIRNGEKMLLPPNLYIWATMNTSDQSLFPIDSAFKRRWDWKYMPIDTKKENWYIKVGNECYSWTTFLEKVNNELLTDETAEDKHLGFYFCKAENNEIATEKFVGKVLFYLWNDVFKIYGIPTAIGSSKDWGYTRFYNPDGSVNEQKVADLMKQLKIVAEDSVYGNINGQIEEQS